VAYRDGPHQETDMVFSVRHVGRTPNSTGLGLEEAGVKLRRRREIVDQVLRHRRRLDPRHSDVTNRINLRRSTPPKPWIVRHALSRGQCPSITRM